MLVDLGNSRSYLRLLLVSRPTLEIETSVERLAKRMTLSRMALDCYGDDLALYVRDEMDVMMGDDDFKERIVKQILAKAGQKLPMGAPGSQRDSRLPDRDPSRECLAASAEGTRATL